MSSSIVKIHFLHADDGTEQYKRFAVDDDSLTVAAAIQRGLDRLGIASLPCQLKMAAQKRGSDKSFPVHMDDLIEMDHDYTFVDPQIETSTLAANGLSTPPSTPRSPFVRRPASTTPTWGGSTSVRHAALETTPTSSRPGTFVRNRESFAAEESPSFASSPSLAVRTRDAAADKMGQYSSQALLLAGSHTPSSSNATPKYTTLPKTKRINNFYVENMKDIEDMYVSKKDCSGRMFHQIDVVERLGFFQHWKAAFFILCQQTRPELYDAAVSVMIDACFDILRCLWPKLNVIPAEKQMLAEIVSNLTGYIHLKNITLPNRNGNLDHKLKHFRRQHPDGSSPSVKRQKLSAAVPMDEDIDRVSVELNPETDSKILHQLYDSTAIQRAAWEKQLHVDPKLTVGIITKLVSKFRHITADISLIHYDFNILMSARRSIVKSLSETFRRLVPAIYKYARDLRIPEAEISYDSPDEREYMAGPLLAAILKAKCGRAATNYSRLVLDHSDSLDYRNALEQRKAEGITAPSILIIGSSPAASFYIAADDMVFKVRGRFAEALQSYMELVFVSNVKFDKKTNGISYFFEYLMNIKDHQNASRMAVCKELEEIAVQLSQSDGHVNDLDSPDMEEPRGSGSTDR